MGGLVVRTSIEPPLQAATEQALRGGLPAYDRRRGGWRGPVAASPTGAADWMPQLEAVQRPGGTLPEWRLAVALECATARRSSAGWSGRMPRGPASRTPRPWRWTASPGAARRCRRTASPPRGGCRTCSRSATSSRSRCCRRRRPAGTPGAAQIPGRSRARSSRSTRAMAGCWPWPGLVLRQEPVQPRHPGAAPAGSSFKPFVYLPALEAGVPPNQRFLDGPIEVMTPQGPWRPSNYNEGSFNGYVSSAPRCRSR